MRRLMSTILLLGSTFLLPHTANAQASGAEICSATGVCAPVDPLTALAIVGVKTLADEFNKGDKGFGPNGAILKAVNTVLGDLRRGGLGKNNELVKAFETMKHDLTKGPGPNNDVIKLLQQIGVKL